ncbi:DUF6507 family protein [Streptomyces rubradiris]|uniref:Excreted virulence factor EspC, type VII ESX diderm n=1 Tax=Streptomyces rubradiris TaxID=285531 RepID=A0ABQ3RQD2_STRRR|nr:DUF6507 family protein [Streptomyces rubradiris]GHH29096.1 hypothetical protein GCM10018792_73700 [Streptomyces rubradiris]GHI58070.1 hypothetical protein Srubr_79160 [Streptomyces rubradiris]
MTGWDIHPAGVYKVLSDCGTAAKNLSDAGSAVQDNLEEAASAAGTLTSQYGPYTSTAGLVGSALGRFAQHWSRDLVYIAERASRSLRGADEATRHYLAGDVELAANAQREAAKEPKVDLPGVGGAAPGAKGR